MNTETLMVDLEQGKEELTDADETARSAALLWYDQVDAAAVVGAEAKVDGGGRAPMVGRCEEEDDVKGHEGEKWKGPLGLIYKVNG